MITYSIHTLQLHAPISPNEYKRLYAIHHTLHLSVTHKTYTHQNFTTNTYTCRNLPFYGITSITILKNKRILPHNDSITKYYLYININLYNALYHQKNSGANIIDSTQIQPSMDIIMQYLKKLLSPVTIKTLSLKRLDFCLNLIFPDQTQADEYIKLLKKGVPGKVLSEKKHFDLIQHREIPYKDSLLLECKSYSFEIYPKYHQMISRKMQEPDNALGMVRFELRANKTKISQLANKYNITLDKNNYVDFLINAPNISKQEIPHLISKMVGRNNFHSYKHIISSIENSDFKKSEKELMIQIVNYFSKHTSGQHFLDTFNITHHKWNRILKKFDKIQCSPIPIPLSYKNQIYPGVFVWESIF